MDDGALAKALDLLVHLAGEHKEEHAHVAEKGPERMAEGGGGVALHEEVGVPGDGVARGGPGQEQPPAD